MKGRAKMAVEERELTTKKSTDMQSGDDRADDPGSEHRKEHSNERHGGPRDDRASRHHNSPEIQRREIGSATEEHRQRWARRSEADGTRESSESQETAETSEIGTK